MPEYIDREAAIRMFQTNGSTFVYNLRTCNAIISRLKLVPAADVRPVVLCMDCKYCQKADEFEFWCHGFHSPARLVRKDDFCSYGKAKE